MSKKTLGFIGQGWIGKNLADHFKDRGFSVVRYAKEAPHDQNRERIGECDIVFIAVPTPTTPDGFDYSVVQNVIPFVGKGKTAVIKSTILPGTTDVLQEAYPDHIVLHAPEFLREATVRHDIDHPDRNIIGIPQAHRDDARFQNAADEVLAVLPEAPYAAITSAVEAEIIKYGGNTFLYTKVVFMNLLYDLAQKYGASWDTLASGMVADVRIGSSHMQPVHQLEHLGSAVSTRGAGGHCFIKDFAALRGLFEQVLPHEKETITLLRALEEKNNILLRKSGKDIDLLTSVYGAQ